MNRGGPAQAIGKTVELAAIRKDGSEFPIELSLCRWESPEGANYSGIIRDISERKRAEERLELEEEFDGFSLRIELEGLGQKRRGQVLSSLRRAIEKVRGEGDSPK